MNHSQPEPEQLHPETPAPAPQQQQFVRIALPQGKPIVATVILAVTVAVYGLQILGQVFLNGDLLAVLGMKANAAIQAGQLWRLFTPMLLHGSILHIAFNMYALQALGPGIERYYGKWGFLLLYLLGGFSGNVTSFLLTQKNSLGASTAIFGLVAAQGIFIYRNRSLFGRNAQAMLANIIGVVVINLVLGLSPGIDNWGHLGGLLGGAGFAWLAGPVYQVGWSPLKQTYELQNQTPTRRVWEAAIGIGALFALAALVKIIFG